MKKRVSILLAALLLLCLGGLGWAAEGGGSQRVFDLGDILTDEEAAALEAEVSLRREEYAMDVVILTLADAEGKSTQAYMDDYYDYNGFGAGDTHDGILLCIDMDNREINLSTTGKMIDIISDRRYEAIMDAMYEQVSAGAYGEAFQAALELLDGYVAAGVEAGHYVYHGESGETLSPEDYGGYAPAKGGYDYRYPLWGALLGALGGGIGVLCIRAQYGKKYKPAPYEFRKQARLSLSVNEDRLVNTFVTTRRIPKSPPPGAGQGGGVGSSVHRGSSGTFHGGGGGRKF